MAMALGCTRRHEPANLPSAPEPAGPVLVITHGPSVPEQVPEGAHAGASLALASLATFELSLLGEALDDLALDVALKKNPLVEDLRDEGSSAEALAHTFEENAARISVARALAAPTWTSGDRDLTVRLAATCADANGARCIPLWPLRSTTAEDAEAERARFFAWPLAHGGVLRTTKGETAVHLARALRSTPLEAASDAKNPIALVLTRSLDDDARPAWIEVQRAAGEALAQLQGTNSEEAARLMPMLSELSIADERASASLPIGDDEVLVVPRIFAVGDPDALRRAVEARLRDRDAHADWVHAPR